MLLMEPLPEVGPWEPPPATQTTTLRQKMTKQLTRKREDSPLHTAIRAGNVDAVGEAIGGCCEVEELLEYLLSRQNSAGETPLYVAAECGYTDLVKLLIGHCDRLTASIKAKNGFDALHIAAKQGDLEILRVLMEAHPELAMTVDMANTTALHTAAMQGHIEVMNYLLEVENSLASIARSNGKTALHSAARYGHVEVVKALLEKAPKISARNDKKGQTALHMAAKGQNVEVVEELVKAVPSLINVVDTKGNTALHIATRKGRVKIVKMLLAHRETNTLIVNRSNETALDTAEKTGHLNIRSILKEHGVPCAQVLKPKTNPTHKLNQTVSAIKHEVHHQLEHTRQTRKRVQDIARRLNKMHAESLNNAINSTTIVAVLITTVAFAAIFTIPGQYVDDPKNVPPGFSLGEAHIVPKPSFLIFFIFDSIALFISLAVVVVQTSVVVIESKAKKQMMAIINKLMWFACLFITVAYLALGFIVVGDQERWLAIVVSIIGTSIMTTTLGTLCYWVVINRMESWKMRRRKRDSLSWGMSQSMCLISDSEVLNSEFKKMYAV